MAPAQWLDIEKGKDLVVLKELERGDVSCLTQRFSGLV
jgi:hypothetical protein